MGIESSKLQDKYLSIISRKEWGARKPFYTDPMSNPVKSVIFLTTHKIQFPWWSEEKAFETLRDIQLLHMYQKIMPDIQYNFLIDEWGNIYEGRGWSTKPSNNTGQKKGMNLNAIFIGYIGNVPVIGPSDSHMKSGNDLISFGMRHGMISYHHHIGGRIDGIVGTTLEKCDKQKFRQYKG